MSPPTGRVLALLELLQSRPGVTAMELAGRLSVDERTVRRDATHLSELGIPVCARRGRYGGFRLAPGVRLPPLMLTDGEAVAVVLGLAAAAETGMVTGVGADNGGETGAETALAKIQRVLPARLAAHTEALLATLHSDQPGSADPDSAYPDSADPGSADPGSGRSGGGQPSHHVPSPASPTQEVEVTLMTTLDEALARIPATLAVLTEAPDGVRMLVRVRRLDGAAQLLAGLGWPFVIHRPDALRTEVSRLAARLRHAAESRAVESPLVESRALQTRSVESRGIPNQLGLELPTA